MQLICKPGHQQIFNEAAVDWLVENVGNPETLGQIDVIELDGITTTLEQTRYFCDLLVASGLKSHTSEIEGGWRLNLPQTWEELNSSLSKSMRRKTSKAVKRLSAPDVEIASTQSHSFDLLWEEFVSLHQKRRKRLGQPGCFADKNFEEFLKAATESMVADGSAELIMLYKNGTPLATIHQLFDDSCVHMYQSGVDPDRMELEPGYQIWVCAIKRAIENGFDEFDFLRGDEPYKKRWNTRRLPIVRKRFIPRTTVANLKHRIWLSAKTMKNYLTAPTEVLD